MLGLLILIPLLVLFYIKLQQRRRRISASYGSFGSTQNAVGHGPGIRRHIPPVLFMVGLSILMIALARPQTVVSLPRQEGTVILAFDVSGSMAADDLKPTRMEAAKAAARLFIQRQPRTVQIGVVAFSDSGFTVQAPTNDLDLLLASINRLTPQHGTSVANGILTSLNTIARGNGQTTHLYSNLTPSPTSTPTLAPTPTETATPVMIPYQAVVKLYAKTKYSSQLKTEWTGSGTIISPDGLILTNAHVVNPPNKYIKVDALVVSMTDNPDLPPVDKYYADVLIVDKTVDIAILRISKTIDFKPVDGASLNLPYVTMGDSDALKLGDPLLILGYPGIGGDTITLTEGDVSGFSSQKKLGERAFIKTAASITGGASGGLVMDRAGLIVAIPTQLGYGGNDPLVDCRVVADTNGDGSIDSSDICVPAGGYINAMRPIKFAIPLIMAAESMAKATETEASPSIDTTATLTSTLQATATLPFTPTVIATVVP